MRVQNVGIVPGFGISVLLPTLGWGGRSPQGDQCSFPYGRTHILAWWTGGASAVPQALHLLTQALQAVEGSWCHLRGHQCHSAWPRPQHGSRAGPQHGGQAGPRCCQVNRFCRATATLCPLSPGQNAMELRLGLRQIKIL